MTGVTCEDIVSILIGPETKNIHQLVKTVQQKVHMNKGYPIVKNGESLIFTRQMTNWLKKKKKHLPFEFRIHTVF